MSSVGGINEGSTRGHIMDLEENLRLRERVELNSPPDLKKLINEWHCGPPCTGKTCSVRKDNPDAFYKSRDIWWDGYEGQDTVVIDDLRETDALKFQHYLIQWGDHYAFRAEVWGGIGPMIRPKKIIVISQRPPSDIWDADHTLDKIKRRYRLIHHPTGEERKV